jgi:DNA repair protein RadC
MSTLDEARELIGRYEIRGDTTALWQAILGDPRAAEAVAGLGREVRTLTRAQLECLAHVGPQRAAKVLAAVELGRRLMEEPLVRGALLDGADAVFRAYRARLMDLGRESVWAVHLDSKTRIIGDEIISIGSPVRCPVYAGDVLRSVLLARAASFLLVHSHPSSGDPQPSGDDVQLTESLAGAARAVGLRMLDHVIIGDGRYYSFADAGRI